MRECILEIGNLTASKPPPRQPSGRVLASSVGGPGFNAKKKRLAKMPRSPLRHGQLEMDDGDMVEDKGDKKHSQYRPEKKYWKQSQEERKYRMVTYQRG